MVDEETLNFRIPVRLGIGPLKIYPRCGVLVAFFTVTEADRVRIPACGLKYVVLV